MTATVTPAVMSDGSPFPFGGLYDLHLDDGRELHDLTLAQVLAVARKEHLRLALAPA